ncbi:MAG: branched-chain amino acid ABC transporter permease [Acidobacteriota bacterium]
MPRLHPLALRSLAAGGILVLAAAPLGLLERGALNNLWYVCFGIVLASAWNILGGMAGQVSFGYAAFVGIGAYAAVLLSLQGINPYWTLPVGGLLAAAFSILIGLPTFRLRGPYFTIATIGISEAVRVFMQGFQWTGGSSGLRMPPRADSFLVDYYSMLALAAAVLVLVWWIERTRLGLALRAVRQDVDAAEALGVPTARVKLAAHALSAFAVGVAGGLYAINFQYIAPNSVFAFTLSLSIVLMPVIGGIGTLAGPVIGAVVFQYLQLKLLANPLLSNFHLFIYGLLLIVVMLFEPRGLWGLLLRGWRWISYRPGGSAGKATAP